MEKRLFIHIGMQKTGTTFLQSALHEGAVQLRELGLVYPNTAAGLGTAPITAHHFLAHAVTGKRKSFTPNAEFSELGKHVETLRAELGQGDVGVISSEELSALREAKIAQLRSLFPEDGVKVLVYLRRQDAWIDSLYGQMLKVGRDASLDEFLKAEAWRLDYEAFLSPWASAFGEENIVVRPYDPSEGVDLWTDFMATIGKPEASSVTPKAKRANASLSYELTMFLKALNIYGQQRDIRRMLEHLQDHFPNDQGLKYLPEEAAREILERASTSNQRVAQRFLGGDTLFSNLSPLQSTGRGDLTPKQVTQVFGGITIRIIGRLKKLEQRVASMEKGR